jgi:predicted nucleotidyltransferase
MNRYYIGLTDYYTKEDAKKDAKRFSLKLVILGESFNKNYKYDAYFLGTEDNINRLIASETKSNANLVKDSNLQLKDVHKGFAIVIASQYKRYGKYAYVYNIEPTKELADNSKASFERCDKWIKYKIVNCNTTTDSIQGLDYTEEEVLDIVREIIDEVISINDLTKDKFKVNDIQLHGSRLRNTAKEDSDLDIVISYEGALREDDAFNMFHRDEYSIDDIVLDFNPIKEDMDSYMERSKEYDKSITDSRADMLEATVMHIANELYKKKDKFGLVLSQKDLDEIIHNLNSSPVFKRLVEQEVRNWIKTQDDLNV